MYRIAMVARWKPVHNGHAEVLRGLVASGAHCFIGIGSCNRHDARNPFTADESEEMIRRVLAGATNVTIFDMPDFDDGPKWRAHIVDLLGDLDVFVTANPYVATLMREAYEVAHPAGFVRPDRRVRLDATTVRAAMLAGEAWVDLVPPEVAAWLRERDLVARFRREFGEALGHAG